MTDAATKAPLGAVLLVEDSVIIAMGVEDSLLSLGARTVETVVTLAEAEAACAGGDYSAYVFDLDLGGESSLSLIQRLVAAGRRVVVTSGSEDNAAPLAAAGVPVLIKPVTEAALQSALDL